MSDKLERLKAMKQLIDDGLTRKEFEESFRVLIDAVKKIGVNSKKSLADLESKYADVASNIKLGADTNLKDVRTNAEVSLKKEMDKVVKDYAKMVKQLDKKLENLKGELTLNNNELALLATENAKQSVLPFIPKIEDIEKNLPKLGVEVASALELLPEKEKLEMKAIKGLKEELEKLRKEVDGKASPGGVAASGKQMYYYDLSSSLDGVTKVFTLPTMGKIITVHLSSVPNILRPTTDFTHSHADNQITFTSEINASTSLATGQTCIITYSN